MKKFITVNDYCRKVFGTKVYKIALSCSNTCPNRDGTKGYGGCIFCSKGGSGDFASNFNEPVSIQIENGKKLLGDKAKNCKFIAYFQSFTSTYGDLKSISDKIYKALEYEDIVGISIATRPDCLTDDVMIMFADLSLKTNLWVELGLQTTNEETARLINRCYTLEDYDSAIVKLKNIKAHIITHVIIGLPGETKSDILNTVKYVSEKSDGIKLQLLFVLKGTKLESYYKEKMFSTLSLREYCDLLASCVKALPDDMIIHRLTGDPPKKDLVAPLWSSNKKRVLAEINRTFIKKGIIHKPE